jgi:membrane protein YdbS with pleckstrin-like domain
VDTPNDSAIYAIERPHSQLWIYYVLTSLAAGPGFPFLLVYRYFRYHTMRYRFDEEGVSMSWGVLFRREINLTYARIQDIHLSSNIVERWLGLARVQIQTASGSSGAEMTIEGLQEFEQVRDFLYTRMRGARRLGVPRAAAASPASPAAAGGVADNDVAAALRDVAVELRAVRSLLERGRASTGEAEHAVAGRPPAPPLG